MILAGEGSDALDSIWNVNKKIKIIERQDITITDSRKLEKVCYKEVSKESNCAEEVGAIIEVIRREIINLTTDMSLEYSNDKPRLSMEFHQQLEAFWIKN